VAAAGKSASVLVEKVFQSSVTAAFAETAIKCGIPKAGIADTNSTKKGDKRFIFPHARISVDSLYPTKP
jgi:hypothetical protein